MNNGILCISFLLIHSCADTANTKLTERHLVDEAEMTLHHLGPGQFGRRITRHPVEAVSPHRVTEESRVIGGWSLIQEKFKD